MDVQGYAVDHEPGYEQASRGYQVIGASILFIVLSVVFTLLRVWARHLQRASWMVADVLVPVGCVFVIALCAVAIASVQNGSFGKHTDTTRAYHPATLPFDLKMIFLVMPCLYFVAVALPKLALLSLYLHVFTCKKTIFICYGIGAIVILTAFVNTFVTIFQCNPVSDLWAPVDIGHGRCMDVNVLFQWASFPNILTDVAMLILPIPMIWRLQTGWRVRLGVFVTFLTGSIGLAASIARFAAFTHSTAGDPLWDAVPAAIWAIAEPGILLIAACLVTLKPLFQHVLHKSSIASFLSNTKQSTTPWPKNVSGHTLGSMDSARGKGSVVPLEQISAQKAQLYAQGAYSSNFV